jgi:hypothetical protein
MQWVLLPLGKGQKIILYEKWVICESFALRVLGDEKEPEQRLVSPR